MNMMDVIRSVVSRVEAKYNATASVSILKDDEWEVHTREWGRDDNIMDTVRTGKGIAELSAYLVELKSE